MGRSVSSLLIISGILLCFSPSFAAEPASRVRLARIPSGLQAIRARIGANGTIHILADSDDGARYIASRDAGATFTDPIPIVDAASLKPGLKFSAWDLAVAADGRVHVAMSCNAWKLKLPQEEWACYLATLAPGAKAFSPVRNLNRTPSEGFALAAGPDGRVTASFLSGKLFVMASRDDGQNFTAPAELDSSWDPCDCCTTSLAYGADGRLALLYREQTDNNRDMHLVLWDQEGRSTTRTRISASTPATAWKVNACPMTYFTVEATAKGYIAAWPTKGRLYFAHLDLNGVLLPPGEVATAGTSGMRQGLLALDARDGATLIAWKDSDTLGWQLYAKDSRPIGAPGSARSSGPGAAGVALPDGAFILFP